MLTLMNNGRMYTVDADIDEQLEDVPVYAYIGEQWEDVPVDVDIDEQLEGVPVYAYIDEQWEGVHS